MVDGGWHGEGRAAVLLASPSCVWCLPSVCVAVSLNGGCGVCRVVPLSRVVPVLFAVFPVFELDPAPRIVQSLLHCILSCRTVCFLFVLLCCCGVCGEWGGGVCCLCSMRVGGVCGEGGVCCELCPTVLFLSLCSLSQHCWFSVVSL